MAKIRCPECSEMLNQKTNICACGWVKETSPVKDDRCSFRIDANRCKLPGTAALGLQNNQLLCSAHFTAQNDYELSKALLIEINANYEEWASRKSWRIELLKTKLPYHQFSTSTPKKDLGEMVNEIKKRLLCSY